MHIALIHDSVIPPVTYGGIPRVIYNIAKGLVKNGHKVSLLALPGTKIDGSSFIDISGVDINSKEIISKIPETVDLVHFHYNPKFEPDFPYLVSIHGNSNNPEERFLPYTNFLSKSHAKNHGASRYVHNGVAIPKTNIAKKEDYFIFLAKVSWTVKNVRTAIQLCKESKNKIKVCGGNGFSFSKYIKYMGMINEEEKKQIIPPAKALLFPANWYDPCPVAVLEAQAYGTPVIASPNGSLPELVKDGYSGYICSSYEEFLEAMNKIDQISPENTRNWIKQNYSLEKMTEGYLNLYREILNKEDWGEPPHSIRETEIKKIYKRTLANYIYFNVLH